MVPAPAQRVAVAAAVRRRKASLPHLEDQGIVYEGSEKSLRRRLEEGKVATRRDHAACGVGDGGGAGDGVVVYPQIRLMCWCVGGGGGGSLGILV